jgi:DUF2075 family protein
MLSSDAFYNFDDEPLDVLLVDEAHRLVLKSGVYRNRGENQVAELIAASRVTVFFLDETQSVTWRDIGTRDEIVACAERIGIPVADVQLEVQFRCTGADDYVDWVDRLLGVSPRIEDSWLSGAYRVAVLDSPQEIASEIDRQNMKDPSRSSRLVASYCWDWVSRRDPTRDDIVLCDGFSRKWNLTSQGQAWMAHPSGADQVGCVFTVQGLEAPLVGVIMGDDLVARDGQWLVNTSARAKTDRQSLWGWQSMLKEDEGHALERAGQIIKNQYKVLMSRGTQGTLIYSTDAETREFLRSQISSARQRSLRVA